MACSMLFTFFGYMVVSMVEMVGWILYLTGSPTFFGWYVSIIGYYGAIVLYAVPVILASMHIAVTLKGKATASPGAYCCFLVAVGGFFWLLNVFVHLSYSEGLLKSISKCVRRDT